MIITSTGNVPPTAYPPYRAHTRLSSFDIDDRKGLEIVLLAALLTFQDSSDEYHTPHAEATPTTNPFNRMLGARQASGSGPAPTIPPKPAPRTGIDRVAELHAIRGDSVNEITVEEEIAFGDWALYCDKLLQVCWYYLLYIYAALTIRF